MRLMYTFSVSSSDPYNSKPQPERPFVSKGKIDRKYGVFTGQKFHWKLPFLNDSPDSSMTSKISKYILAMLNES